MSEYDSTYNKNVIDSFNEWYKESGLIDKDVAYEAWMACWNHCVKVDKNE